MDFHQECVCERPGEQFAVPSPSIMEENVEVTSLIPRERCLAPQIQEQSIEVIKVIPQRRVSVRIVEQSLDSPVPQTME